MGSIHFAMALIVFPLVNLCSGETSNEGIFMANMGTGLLSQCISAFLTYKILTYNILLEDTEPDRRMISRFIPTGISISAIVAAAFFVPTVYMDGGTLQNIERWQLLAIFTSLWFMNTCACIRLTSFMSVPAPLTEPLPTNNPRVPLIAPPTATTSPIPTYGSFSQPEPPLPAYESLLAPPPSYAEITKKTNQPPNHPQPPLDTTLNSISMLLYPSLSALFRPSPISSEYIALEEGSQQSADDNSAPSPSAPLLSEEESQQSADDDSVPSPSAPPFFP